MKNKQKNFFSSSRAHELPELEKFKKLSFISLEPNQIETKNYTKKTENSHTKENYLNENCGYYINKFNKVSLAIIGEKFEKINKEIDYILNTLKNEKSYETFFHSLILNTDQNEDIFFDQLEKYFTNKQGYRIEKLFDYSFNEIKNLFKNLYNDNCSEDNSIKDVEMDNSYCAKKVKLLLINLKCYKINLFLI